MKTRSKVLVIGISVGAIVLVAFGPFLRDASVALWQRIHGRSTISDRIRQYGGRVRVRLQPEFERAKVPYPPVALTLIGFKQERVLEVYASGPDQRFHWIRSYPILDASGGLGPKLREGDAQVPEGLYRVESLNPNSLYHLALRVNYPNDFDRGHAGPADRTNLGGNIMIHGSNASEGCLAMGDEAVEDLFVLASLTGSKNIQVILAPLDFRQHDFPAKLDQLPTWIDELYQSIGAALHDYPKTH